MHHAGPMLMHTDNRRVDHLHGSVMGASESFHDLGPDARSSPANEAVVASGVRASPSTEETMSHQLGARGNDRDQHQLLECLRCNFIAHMLSDVHAEHDWQHRSRRD